MWFRHFSYCLLFLVLVGCGDNIELKEQAVPNPALTKVSYSDDVKPIIESKCVACHGCFDAPCQLKLESTEGLLRGASTTGAYDGARLTAMQPTRLGVDASSEKDWRDLGFHSLINADESGKALLYKMVNLGKRYSFPENEKLPEAADTSIRRDNVCPTNDAFSDYESHHGWAGMPFAVTGLTDEEYALIAGWIEQGGVIDESSLTVSDADATAIEKWETYLNRNELRRQLVSRWLYEHLFLAHLYFKDEGKDTRYFELVRSYSPPGEPIDIVKTRLPNGDAEAPVFYRLRPVEGIIVHKRHINFRFDSSVREEIEKLFFTSKWQVNDMPGYAYHDRANPFLTYQAIPSKARYQFMLDNAEYFVRTFIRGPVCRGQIATDVIRDQFWVMFQQPEKDLYITDKAYAYAATPLLGLPGQDDRIMEMGSNWESYKKRRNQYLMQRDKAYSQRPDLSSLEAIWDGDEQKNTNALLTVFRHFDSASVRRGFIGAVPETLWWMDYPLFERTYYELVVNFDVFGNVAHQLQTRLYFDLIRNGAEHNFLRLLPADKRKKVLSGWYQGFAAIKADITYAPLDVKTESQIEFESDDTKSELAGKLLNHFAPVNAAKFDPINRCQQANCSRNEQADWIQTADQTLHELTGQHFEKHPGLLNLPELTFVRVKQQDGERTAYSLVRNRYHTNVAFLFGESWRYKPEQDTLTVYPGIAGSYPNFIFDVPAEELSDFTKALLAVQNDEQQEQLIAKWGVRRMNPQFWDIVHDFTAWQREHDPLEAGIFDVNRYENL